MSLLRRFTAVTGGGAARRFTQSSGLGFSPRAVRGLASLAQPDVGFRLSIEGAKALFFDRAAVLGAVSQAERNVLREFGRLVRLDARQNIRRRKSTSEPGQGPTNRTGLLKRFIFYTYDAATHSVVIGPTQLEGYIRFLQVPRVLEEGGWSRLTFQTFRTGVGPTTHQRRHRSANVYGRPIQIAARPYMKPAFERQRDEKMPAMWRDSLIRYGKSG